mgnify:CR=1 FL=1
MLKLNAFNLCPIYTHSLLLVNVMIPLADEHLALTSWSLMQTRECHLCLNHCQKIRVLLLFWKATILYDFREWNIVLEDLLNLQRGLLGIHPAQGEQLLPIPWQRSVLCSEVSARNKIRSVSAVPNLLFFLIWFSTGHRLINNKLLLSLWHWRIDLYQEVEMLHIELRLGTWIIR